MASPESLAGYASDWLQSVEGVFFSGDPLDNRSYYAYAKPVLAVADATVVVARDGFPDNVPRHQGQFHTAVPVAMETALGIASLLIWAADSSRTTRTCNRVACG